MIGVLSLFTMYKEKNIFMVALEKDKAGVVSLSLSPPLFQFPNVYSLSPLNFLLKWGVPTSSFII